MEFSDKRRQFSKYIFTVILTLLLLAIPFDSILKADRLTTVSDQLSSVNSADTAFHTIKFVIVNAVSTGQNIQITIPGAFSFGGSYNFSDMVLAQGNSSNCSTASFTNKTLAASPSGTTWGAAVSSNVVTFTSGTDSLTAGNCVKVVLNTNGAGHTLTNPTVTSNTVYNPSITTSSGDAGQMAVVILGTSSPANNDKVQINALVAPSILMGIDVVTSNCNNETQTTPANQVITFGILNPGTAYRSGTNNTPFICVDFATNTSTGAKLYVQSSRNNAVGGLVGSTDVIASSTANLNLTGTSNGYGLRVSSTGTPAVGSLTAQSPFNSGTAGSVGQISGRLGSASNIISSSAQVRTGINSRIAIEVGVKASTNNSAESYSDTLTFTALTSL